MNSLGIGENIRLTTVALDDRATISIAIDKGVESKIFGPDGKQIMSGIENGELVKDDKGNVIGGQISADGGTIVLNAKVLNGLFKYAINNAGIIEAHTLATGENGEVTLTAEGAPIFNTGTIEAGKVTIDAIELINLGNILSSTPATSATRGSIYINALTLQQDGRIISDGLVSIKVDNLDTTAVIDTTGLGDNPGDASLPAAIIRGKEVRITFKKLGSSNRPIRIDAPLTYIYRMVGDIDISESLGIGTSIWLRGPPADDFSIIYLKNTYLHLEASAGSVLISEAASIVSDNLCLKANKNITISGALIVPNSTYLYANGPILNTGLIDTAVLIEKGYSFKSTGTITGGSAYYDNADGAANLSGNIGSNQSDKDDINLIGDVTLTADVTFSAGTDGTGGFFAHGYSINSHNTGSTRHHRLTINAASNSTLGPVGNINTLGRLTVSITNGSLTIAGAISTYSGGNVTFTASQDIIQQAAISTNGGNYTATAGRAYIFTVSPSITPGSGIVTIIAPIIQESFSGGAIASYSWSYLAGDRGYDLTEFGYYFVRNGTIIHIPSARSGDDIDSPIAGTQDTNITDVGLYIVIDTGSTTYRWYSDSTRNADGEVHARIGAPNIDVSGIPTYNPDYPVYNWEDQSGSGADADYNDVILQTQLCPTLRIIAGDLSKTYGSVYTFDMTTPSTDFTVIGLLFGDSVTSITLSSSGAAAAATVADSPYPVIPSAAVGTGLNKYYISYENGTLTVNKADATVSVTGYSGTYDAAAHGAAGTATGVGGVDLSASLNLGATFTDVPGGTANWTFTGGTNYNDQNGSVAINIGKADATVSVTGYSGTYDGASHGATGTATGVKGEDLSQGFDLGATYTNVPGGIANWIFKGGTNYNNASGSVDIIITAAAPATITNWMLLTEEMYRKREHEIYEFLRNVRVSVIDNPHLPYVYYYHPLTPYDMAAFDAMALDAAAYNMIGGSINLMGHEGLMTMFEEYNKKR